MSSPSLLAGGRYELTSVLGEGARKRVYRATDTLLGREVAVALMKIEHLDDAGLTRLRREARAMARLGDNTNIVTVHDIGEERGQPYIVSQHMQGGSVADLLAATEGHRLPIDVVVAIGAQICDALDYAHRMGIVHRDVKPANVWLSSDGTAKLGDFGLAVGRDPTRVTVEGMIVGTLAYMPPELASGVDSEPRSDLYSVGAMLYEMLTGRPPFLGENAVAIISQHLNTEPVAPSWHNPEVPRALEDLVLSLLAKEPADRPADAGVVKGVLEEIGRSPVEAVAEHTAETNQLDRLASGVFVGRSFELDELRAGLDDALRGRGSLALLVGEPGIGKTRIADELATYAGLRGAQVLWGRCYESDGAPVYWPWVQVIRSYVHERDEATLRSEMGTGAADIAQVVSNIHDRLPGLPVPPQLEPEQARFRLFDSVATFLKNAARHKPLVLILDDIHSADEPSLMLLQFLARELRGAPLLVVATYRDMQLGRHHPLSKVVAALAGESLSRRVVLRGLGEEDVARYIEMTTRLSPPPELVTAVYRETEGNPFFVSEVVRLLAAEGRLDPDTPPSSWSVGIPQGVREVVGRRLEHLTDDCNKVLTIASILGREFDLDTLEIVSERKGNELLDVIDEAIAARLVTEQPETPGHYRFSHAIVRETLYADVPSTRRMRLHQQIGEAIERQPAQAERRLAELALHFAEGAAAGDPGKAVRYARLAADHAMEVLAYEEGARLYQMALDAAELHEPDPLDRCDLLILLGDARIKSGSPTEGQAALWEAAELAKALERGDKVAAAALAVGGQGPLPGVVDQQQVAYLEDALQLLPPGDSALKARVMGRLTVGLHFAPDQTRRNDLSVASVEMARRVGDHSALTSTLNARRWAVSGPEDIEERLRVTSDLIVAAAAAGDKELEVQGHLWALVDHLEVGNLLAVDDAITAYERLAAELRQPIYRWGAIVVRVMRAALGGKLHDAERLAERARIEGQRGVAENAEIFFGSQTFCIARDVGRLEEAEKLVAGLAAKYPAAPLWRCELVNAHALLGRDALAREEFEALALDGFAGIASDYLWLTCTALLAEVCDHLGDARRAEPLYKLLLPYEDRNIVVGRGGYCLGSAARYLGILASLMGKHDEAEGHFEKAMQMHRRLQSTPWQAHTRFDFARMLLRRGFVGDDERAEELLTGALSIAREAGMTILIGKIAGLRLEVQGHGLTDSMTTIDSVTSSVQRDRPDLRGHTAPDGTVTIMFSDIEGSTRLTDRLGDRRWMEVLAVHNDLVRREVEREKGFEVKSAGDGFMIAFSSARRAVRASIAIQQAFAAYNADHPDVQMNVRIGLHTGEAIREADDFYGRNVILAARIGAAASGGEILVSSVLKALTDSTGEFEFEHPRELELKGLSGTHTAYAVAWRA
jgi:class 3 adenylate cyclase/tetratricopeptide (TPR) repeat protein/tRNA A-37 threonylcarbamoyl transferase component Bud32